MKVDKSTPLVTVVIPNYNHAAYLPLRISSVLNQTYKNTELLILDDCSGDNSREVINRYAAKDHRIHTVFNDTNSGSPFKQWNKGISLANGKYIWIAESDDYADERFLEKLVSLLEKKESISLAYCQSYNVDDKNNIISSRLEWTEDIAPGRWQQDFINNGEDELASYFVLKNTIPNASAVVCRKNKFVEAGGAYENMRLNGDKMTWTRLLLKGEIAFCAEHLNYFRHHTQNVRSKVSYKNKLENFIWAAFLTHKVRVGNDNLRKLRSMLLKEWSAVLFNRQRPDFLSNISNFVSCGRQVSLLLLIYMLCYFIVASPLILYRIIYWQIRG